MSKSAAHILAPSRYKKLIYATVANKVLRKLTAITKHGTWPNRFNTAPSWLQLYNSFSNELLVEDGIIYRGANILIPRALCQNYIQQLHKMNQFADSTLKLIKQYSYWPKLSADTFLHVKQCSICNSVKQNQQKNR